MKIAIDNDFFCKTELLGVADLILDAFGASASDCMLLPTLRPQLRNKRRSSKLYKKYELHAEFLLQRSERYSTLKDDDAELSWRNRMAGVDKIDPGEAIMLAYVASTDTVLLATHDKNCLRAIPQVEGLAEAVEGRVVILEAAMIKVCAVRGVQEVHAIACPNVGKADDNAMKACFGGQASSVMDALGSYMKSLGAETDSRVLWIPQ